jgi:hypothetical protein
MVVVVVAVALSLAPLHLKRLVIMRLLLGLEE